ncbi:MAG: hypothetical protein ACRDHZ_03370, partial [Ktedonobacteraceae bacterium]
VLYHMVTGRVPFQSESIIEVAMQHVKAIPPAPSSLRPDLPQAAAQVILRALAKAPAERYACAQELSSAFRLALHNKQAPDTSHTPAATTLAPRSGGLFDPKWQAFTAASTTPIQLDMKGPDELQFSLSHSPLPHNEQITKTITPLEPLQTTKTLSKERSFIASLRFGRAGTKLEVAKKRMQVISLILVALIIMVGSGIFWSTHTSSPHPAPIASHPHVSATVHTNLILSDDLSQNTRNWVVGSRGSFNYVFKDGAYLIANADKVNSAPALLPNRVFSAPFVYSLTMEQLQGNLSSPNNQFGMLLDTTDLNKNGRQIETFYTFEVVNTPGGQYQFWKYDNSKGSAKPWTLLWSKNFGTEFQQGSGPDHINTLKVMDTGKNFTFMVNGTQVGMWKDGSFTSGSIGMLVNLNGAEVAFSRLLVTSM